MRKTDNLLIWILMGALALCVALGLRLDADMQMAYQPAESCQVLINEICAKNETVIADNDGKYRDYIELYNPGPETNLSGYRLTDGSVSFRFDSLILGAGEYRLLFLGSETTGFSLSASGRDSIQLQDPTGRIVSQAKLQSVMADQVMVYGNGVWQLSDQPTPGFSNDRAGRTAFVTGTAVDSLDLQISEILIANRMSLPDEQGIYSDVVELYNPGDTALRLNGWCLSDQASQRFRYRLPDVSIAAGGYLLIHCDGENYLSDEGTIHANFALNAQEALCLTAPSGDYVTVQPQYSGDDISLALTEAGYRLMASSLGFSNTVQGCSDALQSRIDTASPLVISEVLRNDAGVPYEGRLAEAVELYNRSSITVNTAGWYLSDGGDPYAYALPAAKVAPGEFLVIPVGQQTTGFGLSGDDVLYLTTPAYRFSQPVACSETRPGCSISVTFDGVQMAYELMEVSLGYENTQAGIRLFQESAAPRGLRLNEAMSSNSTYLTGPYGNATDWVEFYNDGTTAVQLSDYRLMDGMNGQQYPLPDLVLNPGAYAVILLSESNQNLRAGYEWLPFGLSAAGDGLYLMKDGMIEDYLILPALYGDVAWGRPAGKQYAAKIGTPTPERANAEEALMSQMPTADLPQGAYNDVTGLSISFSGPGQIYYTTDCKEPDQHAQPYTGPIWITETTVFRVIAYEEGRAGSEILDLTYLVNEEHGITAVCLVADPADIWGNYDGIYVTGDYASKEFPYYGANYWRDTEQPATATLFETDGSVGFSERCGLKIFGGFSRVQAKKSFACMFRNRFGNSSLDYPLFGEEGIGSFESFVLRSGGQDATVAKIRDEVITSLASDYLGLPVQRNRPAVLYLNGQYWGIYYIREKLNEQYVAGNFNTAKENVTLAQQSGSNVPEYSALLKYAQQHDLSDPECYAYVCSQINVDNYMDYVITQLWIENTDLGNVKFFKTTGMPWHWALFDTDASMRNPARNSVEKFLRPGIVSSEDNWSRLLVTRLLQNPQFQDAFLRRMAWQLENVWNEKIVVERIDRYCQLLKDDMQEECARWNPSVRQWEKNVQEMRNFASRRNDYFIGHVQTFFGLTDKQMRAYGFEV